MDIYVCMQAPAPAHARARAHTDTHPPGTRVSLSVPSEMDTKM
jgi:hypothetical protein